MKQVSVTAANAGRNSAAPLVKVGVDIRNTGKVAGTEVVQLSLRNKFGSLEQPVRELKGFQRVSLAPGEQKHVEFNLGFDELAFYNARLERAIETTRYPIFVGNSSRAAEHSEFEITK